MARMPRPWAAAALSGGAVSGLSWSSALFVFESPPNAAVARTTRSTRISPPISASRRRRLIT